ncbi:hypothetical protein ACWGNM_41305, partial [Streptomyces sp. NPDC055796]
DRLVEAFRRYREALNDAVSGRSETEGELPARSWTVRDLLGRVCVVIDCLPGMSDGPAPSQGKVSAVEYHHPEDRLPARRDARLQAPVLYRAPPRLVGSEPLRPAGDSNRRRREDNLVETPHLVK